MRIGYFADGPWAHEAFHKLYQEPDIVITFVCVRYDKPDEILIQMAKERDIPCYCEKNVNSDKFLEIIGKYKADLFVSMSFNQIFRTKIIEMPKYHIINCHAGKLPYYRGRNILNWVLINDEKEFGITVHYVDTGIDTGDILLQRCYPITDEDDYGTLLKRAYEGCASVLYDAVKMIADGTAVATPQKKIASVGMYCGMRRSGDEIIDWRQSSRNIFNFVRALTKPGPGAVTFAEGHKVTIYKVREVLEAPHYKNIDGLVLEKTKKGFYIKTEDSLIELLEYECDRDLKVGDRLGDMK